MIEHANVVKTTCTGGNVCFTAGTLIHTIHGLKPIETIEHGDLIWSRQEFGDEYDYRPVIATKATPNQEIYEVVVKHSNNSTETFKTTKEHPFWVEGIGWLKASLLEQGMTLLDKHGLPNVTILSQTKLDHTETVYNFEVQDFHTYHIGEYMLEKPLTVGKFWVILVKVTKLKLDSTKRIIWQTIWKFFIKIMNWKFSLMIL